MWRLFVESRVGRFLRCWLFTWHAWEAGARRIGNGPWMRQCETCGVKKKAKDYNHG